MKNEFITIQDANGAYHIVTATDLIATLQNNAFTLFGMDVGAILELRKWYLAAGGSLPITGERVRDLRNVRQANQ